MKGRSNRGASVFFSEEEMGMDILDTKIPVEEIMPNDYGVLAR
jgi:hypothetical protein